MAVEFVVGVGRRGVGADGFENALSDDVGEAAIGRCGMSVVVSGKTEVAAVVIARALHLILTGTEELDDRQGQIGEVIGILLFPFEKEFIERFDVGLCGQIAASTLG